MTQIKLKEIVQEVLTINLVDWLTKSQIELIELEVAGIDSEESVSDFIFSKSRTFESSLQTRQEINDLSILLKIKYNYKP